ncbi:hypothetical protein RJT34_23212 [Clitoria ternatea]|uniref:Uncharacterized protein n=1 Tax=Clitoria ternatea TaxID=43366 RepID=A0AAN9FKM5_CLITE
MIQELGHVITSVDDLRRTRRISALPGRVYLLVPASKVHRKASEFETGIAEQWGERKKKSGNKVLPLSGSDGDIEVCSFQEKGKIVGMSCHQLRMQRRWNPVLHPILESPGD